MKRIKLSVQAGTTIYASTGRFGLNQPDRMSSEAFYLAERGSKLRLLDERYWFNVATYAPTFDAKYLHTYDYEPEESWTTYLHDLGGDTYRQGEYIFSGRCYFRVCLKRADGGSFGDQEAEDIDRILQYESDAAEDTQRELFQPEIERAVAEIAALREDGDLVFAVLTDTHRTVNGTWETTAANLAALQKLTPIDAVVHLGDFTDGMVSRSLTERYIKGMLEDLRTPGAPLYVVLGNHDSNYFHNNPDIMSISEQVALYQSGMDCVKSEPSLPYYYVDFSSARLRAVFLNAYDNDARPRYGFDAPQIDWLGKVLASTPDNYTILLFAHDAPLAELDFWSDVIRGGDELMRVCEEHQRNAGNILAYIHGHTHADYIYTKRAFPIASIGCAKCEDMTDKKPPGSYTQPRRLGTISQELWDVLVVKPQTRRIECIRVGAGSNRQILARS